MAKPAGKRGSVDGKTHLFQLSSNRHTTGMTLRGAIQVAPKHLVGRFGAPSGASGDGKVSGTYVFEDERGNALAIYDWKSTSAYSARSTGTLPSVEAFWESEEPAEFSLAASGSVDLIEFARWVGAKSIGLSRTLRWTELQ